ncbi:hypothetical protein AB0H34_34200 [Saccharopolyspora shandongensis]|uniref:hypothetical protein n=1 Tax=Saccharopolyspora shandongensis TaxID=418495 RepID=UPI0033D69730
MSSRRVRRPVMDQVAVSADRDLADRHPPLLARRRRIGVAHLVDALDRSAT